MPDPVQGTTRAEAGGASLLIQPPTSWRRPDLAELWAARELVLFLTWRDIRVRYKQTALGVGWALLQPVLLALVTTVLFGKVLGLAPGALPYAVFAYSGLLIWTFLSGAISASGNCLVANAPLITKAYFPRLALPLAAVAARCVDLLLGVVVLAALLLYYRIPPSAGWLQVPVLLLLTAALALAVGLWLSTMNVIYRDVGLTIPFLLQVWMLISPVLYPASVLPARWAHLLALNPLVAILEGARASLAGQAADWGGLGIAAGLVGFVLLTGSLAFRTMEQRFADVV